MNASSPNNPPDRRTFLQGLALSLGLIAAEFYAWLVLVLGYIQTAWPLGRKPVAMPASGRAGAASERIA